MFFKEVNEIDLGETTIANIFIDIFMPMANGLYVKVYLLGYRQACDPSYNPKFNNNSIAKNLNVPLSDVIDAWKFWERKNIIKMHKNEGLNDFDYSIEFLDLKRFYMDNMHINTSSIKSNTDSIVSVSENPSIRKMFNSINQIIGRYLDPGEKISILDIMNKYNMDPDMILYAYEYVRDKHGSARPVKYIESILRSWYDSNLYTPQDVKDSFAVKSERYVLYKTIFNELGFYRPPSKSEEKIMNTWLDKYNMDIEVILSACSKSKNISKPSISYINGIIENWKEKNVKTLDDVQLLDDEFKQKMESKKNTSNNNSSNSKNSIPKVKTRFHNINQTFTKYTPEELEKLLRESQKDKFK
ncbi:DnaD domain protein [Romboutsia maritimum]|uniref:DnaD domain protein n=1 Tax=Romboutsia maritimum TaxID=2020948 RepID=A0A371ISJ3_9FIRM|nr:DnaD domain protein [Romboutsia maritimum]RDY23456.1 DnaD domain protein [Romboutsia maritimum]